jgi:ribosomal protein S18 acetylase RimI-like enzyme
MNRVKANIDNLTSLWECVGVVSEEDFPSDMWGISVASDGAWPNKIWLRQGANALLDGEALQTAQKLMRSSFQVLTFSYWHTGGEKPELDGNGFVLKFSQVGMSLPLTQKVDADDRIVLKRVTQSSDAAVWSDVFESAFKYSLSAKVVMHTCDKVEYYLAYVGVDVVGTAILYKTGHTVGVHSVGVPPDMRRKGYAEQIMRKLINKAVAEQGRLMVLQASALGRGIYERLGFVEDFQMDNFQLE